jgi:phosphohistidine phosphatase
MELYLVRHAIAADRDPTAFPDDSKRPLTDVGILKFSSAARGLRKILPEVELVYASGYVRAWDTAVILHEETGWPAPVERHELEAEMPPSGALGLLDTDAESIALVGHEPFLSRLASLLITGNESALVVDFKKGGVMALAVAGERGVLRWKATPKMLRALD